MSTIIAIECRIEGVTPLLVHRFSDAEAIAATEATRRSKVGDLGTPREQAEQGLYIGTNGKPIIPQPNLFACIVDAGRFFKMGTSKVTTQKSSIIPACLMIDQLEIPIQHREPWIVDTRPVVIPSTGGRILRHRPKFEDWALDFGMSLDTSIMSEKLLREVVDAAGRMIGLCDYRPARKGPFGRFVVTSWVSNGAVQKKRRRATAKK